MSLRARLLGIRTVEETDGYITIKVPGWFTAKMKQEMADRVTADARVIGKSVRFDIGDRLTRVYRIKDETCES